MTGIGIFLTLLLIGFIFGRMNEAAHFRSLDQREAALSHIIVSDLKTPPTDANGSQIVLGNTVVSVDYFKQFAAALRTLVGGEIGSYQSLLTRARRESIVRMKEQADKIGAKYIGNVRLETSSVFQNARNMGSIEILAYGTAIK